MASPVASKTVAARTKRKIFTADILSIAPRCSGDLRFGGSISELRPNACNRGTDKNVDFSDILPRVNQADTAWMLVSTALVLLMTPALAFFYGGLVRSKNALNTMMMSFISLGFVGVLGPLIGYSLAFATGNDWLGDMSQALLRGVGLEPQSARFPTCSTCAIRARSASSRRR